MKLDHIRLNEESDENSAFMEIQTKDWEEEEDFDQSRRSIYQRVLAV